MGINLVIAVSTQIPMLWCGTTRIVSGDDRWAAPHRAAEKSQRYQREGSTPDSAAYPSELPKVRISHAE
ncbi:MAG TPA: hypothetical protein PLQ12_03060 [Candidatus Defluviicoccus seviourii]|nr:hypothetical protein [Candidatus Defluviicoccus seviourii]